LREFKSGEYETRVIKTKDNTQIKRVDLIHNIFIASTNERATSCNPAYQKTEYEIRGGYIKSLLKEYYPDSPVCEHIL